MPICPHCNSKNVYGVSRIVGYFSRINNWNKSKKSEFKARQQGNYIIPPFHPFEEEDEEEE